MQETLRPLEQKRGQQTVTLAGADRSVAASAVGEQFFTGPLIIAAVIGDPLGRWAELFKTESIAGVTGNGSGEVTGQATGNANCKDTNVSLTLPALHGFMVVRSWQWSAAKQPSPSQQHSEMMSALRRIHERSTHLEILTHDIVSVAALPEPLLVDKFNLHRPPCSLGKELAAKAADATFTVLRHGSTGHCEVIGFSNLRDHWDSSVCIDQPVHIWPLCTQLAHQIVHGRWKVDLSAVPLRLNAQWWRAPVQPSRRTLSAIRANRTPLTPATLDTSGASVSSTPLHNIRKRKWGGAVSGAFDPEHMFRAVEAGSGLKRQSELPASSRKHVRLVLPLQEGALTRAMEAKEVEIPGPSILAYGRVRLDVAAMLASRELYSCRGPLFRYLAADASPQADQSVEVFVSVERIIVRSAVTGKAMSSIGPDNLVERLLPICTLGHCRTDLASKVITQAMGICYNNLST